MLDEEYFIYHIIAITNYRNYMMKDQVEMMIGSLLNNYNKKFNLKMMKSKN